MPCSGPDLSAARKQGREIGEMLLAELIEKHKLLDITADRYKGSGFLPLPNAKERWTAAKEKFVSAVGELFEEDASNSF